MKKTILTMLLCAFAASPDVTAATPSGVPVNPNASNNAKKVLDYLNKLSDPAFNGVISGQNLGHGTEAADGYSTLVSALHASSGKWAGMIGLDYEFLRSYSSTELVNANSTLKAYWNAGGLVTINWSPINPWGSDIRTKYAGTDLRALITPGSGKYAGWISSLDRIAAGLQDLENAGVVVLFRPMQEMNGTWFWWGKVNNSDAHAAYIDVYRHMYNYFTATKRLDNLLWVFSPVGDQNYSSFPYPGADYVDIVAGTSYNDDLIAWGYNDYVAYGKVVGLAEFGPSETSGANGSFDGRKYINKIRSTYPRVAYWVTWHDWPGVKISLVSNLHEQELMHDGGVINRDQLFRSLAIMTLGGVYELEPKHAPGKRLDVAGSNSSPGANVHIWTSNNAAAQRWKLYDAGGGNYELEPQCALGKRLDVAGASSTAGANVQTWLDLSNTAQRWKFLYVGGGFYEIEPQCAGGKRLDVASGGTAPGTNVIMWTDNNRDFQRWKLLRIQ